MYNLFCNLDNNYAHMELLLLGFLINAQMDIEFGVTLNYINPPNVLIFFINSQILNHKVLASIFKVAHPLTFFEVHRSLPSLCLFFDFDIYLLLIF